MESIMVKIGKRGTLVIPSHVRHSYGLEEGDLLAVEHCREGILLRPVVALPVEKYSKEDKARFLLENTVTAGDRAWAEAEVRKMGYDPKDLADANASAKR